MIAIIAGDFCRRDVCKACTHIRVVMESRLDLRLEDLPIFAGHSPEQVRQLTVGSRVVEVRHREAMFKMGDAAQSFGIVLQGAFKLVKATPDGANAIVYFATPGDVLAGLVMASPGVYPVSAVAMGQSVALRIPRQTFVEAWSKNPEIQQTLRNILFLRMSLMHEQKALLKAPLAQKVARELVNLIERYSDKGETFLPIPITRQEIADSVGASVESVIRVMSDWSQNGYLKTTDQVIHVLRMDKILEIMMG